MRCPGAKLYLIVVALFALPVHADVLRVDMNAAGGGDGSTWALAYQDINTAITAASANDDIWVKGGTYTGQVVMKDFVDLYGGFAGTETALSERVLGANETILDAPSLAFGDATVDGQTGTLDGFTITGNRTGVQVWSGAMTIRHCIVRDNGSVGIDASEFHAVTVDGCLVYGNARGITTSALTGCTIYNSTFTANSTQDATFDAQTTPLTVSNSIIWPTEFAAVWDEFIIPNITNSIIATVNATTLAAIGPDVLLETPLYAAVSADDYRLRPDSPGVDVGSDVGAVTVDLLNKNRMIGSGIDMGAYEYDPTGDLDGDTIPDSVEGLGDPDLDMLPNLADLDSDDDDVLDVYENTFHSDDDGIPDYLDTDRDGNGVDDVDDGFIVYVDNTPSAKGVVPDGRSWATAFPTIQEGIDLAGPAGENVDGGKVWIAEGTYGENRTLVRLGVNTGSLALYKRVTLFGGFDGDEASIDERVLEFDKTIIDGATARDGSPAYQVVRGAQFTKLDGLTIRGGRANLLGKHDLAAGLECPSGTWTDINACFFYDNIADYEAGAVRFAGGNPLITNSIFVGNSAMNGGTIVMSGSPIEGEDGNTLTPQLNVVNCTFYGNSTIPPVDLQGSVLLSYGPNTVFRNSIFLNNTDAAVKTNNMTTLFFFGNSSIESGINYSYVQGSGGDLGGNIADDPQFLDAANHDFRFTVESPAYDAGAATSAPSDDIIGQARPRGSAHEMGAFEVGDRQDLDGDTIPDYVEGAGDPDGDNTPNYLDEDSDGDMIPDAVEGEGNEDGDSDPNYLDTDSDNDGRPDKDEGTGDTDGDMIPDYLDDDSDNDGLIDGDEIDIYMTNPLVSDSDGDDLNDGDEVNIHMTNPNEEDSDGDTLLDGEEVNTYMTDPKEKDSDGDTLEDDEEINTYMTDPNEQDSDGDTLRDDAEVNVHMTDPNEEDSDGDTLRDDAELNVHMTNPNEEDTDGDLMRDDFEVNNDLDPNVDDASENPDMDPFDNLNEFNRGSDPQDDNSPFRNLYVSEFGDNSLGDGSEANPWRTIAFAMSQAAMDAAADNFVTIHLAEGLYEEPVIFVENVGIQGAGTNSVIRHFDGNDPIHNVIVAADTTALRDVTVDIPIAVGDDTTLLRIDDVTMIVDGVVFNGRSNLDSTGALVARSGSSDSLITNSTFRNLENGVHAVNSGVRIARNSFEFINQGNAIFIGFAQGNKGDDDPVLSPGLGDGLDVVQTGFNRFRNIDGFFINIDELAPVTTFAEYNDWGTDDPEEIAAGISLPNVKGVVPEVDFEPFLKSRLAPSTVIVPLFIDGVTDGSGKPVPVSSDSNPSVVMSPGIGSGERDPGTGVFLFPNVPSGNYTAEGQADDHTTSQANVSANSGDSIVVPLLLVDEGAATDPEDVDGDGSTNSIDIQLTINSVLGTGSGPSGDVNNDGTTNSIDIQLVINAVLGV